jgi:hypothetical protein
MSCRPSKVLADVRTKLELLLSLLAQVRVCSSHQLSLLTQTVKADTEIIKMWFLAHELQAHA